MLTHRHRTHPLARGNSGTTECLPISPWQHKSYRTEQSRSFLSRSGPVCSAQLTCCPLCTMGPGVNLGDVLGRSAVGGSGAVGNQRQNERTAERSQRIDLESQRRKRVKEEGGPLSKTRHRTSIVHTHSSARYHTSMPSLELCNVHPWIESNASMISLQTVETKAERRPGDDHFDVSDSTLLPLPPATQPAPFPARRGTSHQTCLWRPAPVCLRYGYVPDT